MTPPSKDIPTLPALEEGEAVLQSALQGLHTDVQSHLDSFEENLHRDLTLPIRRTFAVALEAHTEAMAALPPASAVWKTEDWVSVRRYREAVERAVLEPLWKELQGFEIGSKVGSLWEGFQDGLPILARSLPEEILRPEPPDLFLAKPSDTTWKGFRKSLTRGWRNMVGFPSGVMSGVRHLMGSDPPRSTTPSQTVLLRSIAQECLHGHCPLNLTPFSEAFHQHFAQANAELMKILARWNRDWFPLEESLHSSRGHLQAEAYEKIMSLPKGDESRQTETPAAEEGDLQPKETESILPSEALVGMAKDLHEVLRAGADFQSPERPLQRVRAIMEGEWEHLLEEVRVSGSFQRDSGGRAPRTRLSRITNRQRARGKHWAAWHARSLSRIHLNILVLRLRGRWDKTEDDFLNQISEKTILPLASGWKAAREGILALKVEATDVLSEPARGNPTEWAENISNWLAAANEILQNNLVEPMVGGTYRSIIEGIADSTANALADFLRGLPEQIALVPLPEEPDRVEPEIPDRPFPIRDVVLNIMDVLRLETLRKSPSPLRGLLEVATQRCSEIPNIVEFNLASAKTELLTPPEGPIDTTMEDARGLVLEGLEKTAQGLEALTREVPPAWTKFTDVCHDTLAQSFQEVHARTIVEGNIQEQILDVRALLRTRVRLVWDKGRTQTVGFLARISRLIKKGWFKALRAVRIVRIAMGMQPVARSEAERALEILRSVPLLLDPLPLVYRRLFSFSPVSDPALLVSREEEVEWVLRRFQSWKEGNASPNLVTAPLGGGHTSLLNALENLLAKEATVLRGKTGTRLESEEAMAGFLGGLLNLEQEGAWSFHKLLESVSSTRKKGPKTVVFLEGIEHAFLRTVGGTEVFRALISFQAKTSGRIFWLSTTSTTAWKLLTTIEPEACQLMATRPLSPFTSGGLETLIMTRHQRSGLTLEFLPPSDLKPWTRRRLRLARGRKAKQEVLRAEYFDRLFRMSGGSAPMAILLWLRSADFSSERGLLRVRPPNPIRFAFLEELPLSLNFALMAFLEHGSLCLKEYSAVFGVSREEAYQVFEALRSQMLLEPMGGEGSLPAPADFIDMEGRYRLPPILVQAISQQLRNRNILH